MKRLLLTLILAGLPSSPAWAKKAPPPPPPVEVAPPPVDPEAWRATRPAPGPEPTWAPPAAKLLKLTNGVPVYLLETPGLPLLSVRLVMGVGREANPAGKAGLGELTATMLDEGTTTLSADQISSRSMALGAELSVYNTDETAVVSLDALTGASLGPSLDLLADVALHPKFDGKVFARVQKETLAGIQASKSEPRSIAAKVFLQQLFGKTHPYGALSVGDEASVKSLKVGDVQSFYKTWWHAGNAALVVSGATTEAEIKALLDARFGAWKTGTSVRPKPPPPSVPLATRVVFVEQPGAVQAVLRIGSVGLARTAPEFMAANLAGTIFGGMFSSPLNMNLREKHGWAYGAYGGFSETRDHGVFIARTQVQADKTAPAVAEVLGELQSAMAKPPTAQDVKFARDYLVKSLPGNFETNGLAVASLVSIPQFGLGPDAWQRWVRDLSAVSNAEVGQQAARYFDPNHMLIVVVGPKTVEVDDENGGKVSIDVVQSLKDLGHELVVLPAN